jgi:peptidoglycan/LPS O-acetylase OafA/YrhL
MHKSSLEYRPDIDGLRALAILGVVFYHCEASLISGGFVGVDVFFVISGYLITSVIDRQQVNGTFSIWRFFERRIRRIMPALLVVIACTIFVGSFLLMPYEMVDLGKSVKFTVLSAANFYFKNSADDYFNSPVESMPLLHAWSLGVEEQFYVIFPILLLLLQLWSGRAQRKLVVLGGLALLSLGASAFMVYHDSSSGFYMLPYRAWELLLGSLIAIRPKAEPQSDNHRYRNLASLVGLILIALAMVGYRKSTPFPGLAALLPCGGAALLIATGRSQAGWVFKVLASKPFVFIGLISYSVYLWHWPLIIFSRDLRDKIPGYGLVLPVVAILLGYLSWRFVEEPFRDRKKWPTAALILTWAIVTGTLLGFSRYIRKSDGFLFPPSQEVKIILS